LIAPANTGGAEEGFRRWKKIAAGDSARGVWGGTEIKDAAEADVGVLGWGAGAFAVEFAASIW
jgi:hypothetical protein